MLYEEIPPELQCLREVLGRGELDRKGKQLHQSFREENSKQEVRGEMTCK